MSCPQCHAACTAFTRNVWGVKSAASLHMWPGDASQSMIILPVFGAVHDRAELNL